MPTAQYMEDYRKDFFIYCVVMQLSGSPLFYQGTIFVLSVFCAEFVCISRRDYDKRKIYLTFVICAW